MRTATAGGHTTQTCPCGWAVTYPGTEPNESAAYALARHTCRATCEHLWMAEFAVAFCFYCGTPRAA